MCARVSPPPSPGLGERAKETGRFVEAATPAGDGGRARARGLLRSGLAWEILRSVARVGWKTVASDFRSTVVHAQGKILQVSRGIECRDVREPLGVVACCVVSSRSAWHNDT